MQVFLIRHPRPLIAEGICYGCLDIDCEDPLPIAERLRAQLPAGTPIISSPLQRARKLAEAIDADARSAAFLSIDEADEQAEHVWHVRQIFHDAEGDSDFAIAADVDLDATQAGDGVVFTNYRVGFAEDLGE